MQPAMFQMLEVRDQTFGTSRLLMSVQSTNIQDMLWQKVNVDFILMQAAILPNSLQLNILIRHDIMKYLK